MKALFFSDLHGHAWREFATQVKYQDQVINSRLADAGTYLVWLAAQAEELGIKEIIFGGDLFHKKRLIDVPVYNIIAGGLFYLADRCNVSLLAGNHDLTRRSAEGSFSNEHALYALSGHPRIRIIDQPTVLLDTLGMVPYASDRDTTLWGVEAVHQATFLMMHAGVAGAVTGPIEWQPPEPVTVEDLPDLPIYSGHYHKPQVVGGKVTYIGAPMEQVRGDGKDKQRGAVVIDLNNPSEMIRLPYASGPRFLTRRAWKLKQEGIEGHFIDLQVRSTEEAARAMPQVMACGARAVRPVFVPAVEHKAARMKVKLEENGLPSIENLCQRLIETSAGKLDHKALWHLAQEALHAADTQD